MRLRPGLRPGPRWGNLQRSQRPLAGFKGAASRKGRKGKKGEERENEGKGRERKGQKGKKGREGEGRWEGKNCFMAVGGWTPLGQRSVSATHVQCSDL